MTRRSRGSGNKKLLGVDTDLGTDVRTDPMPRFDTEDTDDTDGGFTTIEDGMVGFIPEWDNDETTDFGRTRLGVPDIAEQQTRLHGRAFDQMREGERQRSTPPSEPRAQPAPQIIIEEVDDSAGSSVLVAGVGVLGAMIATAMALMAMLLLLVWFSLRARPVVVVEEGDGIVEDGGDGVAEAPEEGSEDGSEEGSDDDPAVGDDDPQDDDGGAETPSPRPQPAPGAAPTLTTTRFPAHFEFNEWTPRGVDAAAVDELVAKLRDCTSVIVLTGHTDGVGDEGVNERFAIARAAAVRDLIADRGISKQKMVLASAFDGPDAGDAGRRVDLTCP